MAPRQRKKSQAAPQATGKVSSQRTSGGSSHGAPQVLLERSTQVSPQTVSEASPPRNGLRQVWLCWGVLILTSAVLQWSDGKFSGRTFIDYDDFSVVTPMLKLTASQYWNEWFFDRTNYAFPLRDATLFLDQWLSTWASRGIFWASQFFYFAVAMFFVAVLFARVLGPKFLWWSLPLALVILHPFQVEILQWITSRKYVVPAIPMALGAVLVETWRHQEWKHSRGPVLFGIWMVALLCYPSAALWIFWALAVLWWQHRQTLKMLPWACGALILTLSYLAFVGRGTGEVNAGLGSILNNWDKTWFFGSNAVGRGYWNLLLPFWPAPYYNELSVLNRIGLWMFVGSVVAVVVLLAKRPSLSRGIQQKHSVNVARKDLSAAIVWGALGLVFLIPVANTILSFHDFMLADRHFALSLPYFVLAGTLLIRGLMVSRWPSLVDADVAQRRTGAAVVTVATLVWIGAAALTAIRYVPDWRNSFALMQSCARDEESPRCQSQTVRRLFFKDQCSLGSETFLRSHGIFARNPPYALEFRSEMPFYDTMCAALSARGTPDEKLQRIDSLATIYRDSAEVIFAMVLVHLEKGDLPSALGLAQTYYMGPLDKGAIFITDTLLAVYRGHLEVLCEIDPYGPCRKSLERYRSLHPKTDANSGAVEWGRSVTRLMAKRGALM